MHRLYRNERIIIMSILEIIDLKRSYKRKNSITNSSENIDVLHGINFSVQEKEFVGIMGKSGCGKTTLLKTLGLIDKPTSGQVLFKNRDSKLLGGDDLATILRNEIGFIYQDFYLLDSLSVLENIMLPMILNQIDEDTILVQARDYAKQFEIEHVLEKHPYELSGGEKQRAAICRSLMNSPDLLLADEPTGNLDSNSSRNVIQTLGEINEQLGKTIVMVTHDPLAASYCKRVIFFKDGEILKDLRRSDSQEHFYQEILEMMQYL
ncbi:MAG: ABC transporter ATP-binding protein [Eubacteriales bacterium]